VCGETVQFETGAGYWWRIRIPGTAAGDDCW
jgi:hypothetical protein